MISFNINDKVRVRLTVAGRQHLQRTENLWMLTAGYSAAEDAQGWSEWQLWKLMAVFGSAMYLGCSVPFETQIELVVEKQP